ncbi:MAG: glutathione transferase [Bdellovibrionales bacterium CG10_big_fil_rev_8_21_14_0_10_45_34]|nr:MAG: glutathione transferase [Bdellovibrionales bacterium CG10_big_fil_rev_8_21_14_0_10_45_34]
MIEGINHVTLSVGDLDRSFNFYMTTLGCKPLAKWKSGAYLLAGDNWLCLTLDAQTRKLPLEEYTHIAFTVAKADFEKLSDQIHSDGAKIWKKNTSEGESVYFLDPDGHKLEIHTSDWKQRIVATKKEPYDDMEFYV